MIIMGLFKPSHFMILELVGKKHQCYEQVQINGINAFFPYLWSSETHSIVFKVASQIYDL